MRILLASAPVINREIKFNLQTLLEYMKAYRGKAELIVFGESILQGFECLCWDYEKDRSVGISLEDAPVRRIRAAAKEIPSGRILWDDRAPGAIIYTAPS